MRSLLGKSEMRQADLARAIGVQRQQLTYVITGRREMSMHIALRLESYYNLEEGFLMKMQAAESVRKYKLGLRHSIADKLLKSNAFWSYSDPSEEQVDDDTLIEKTLIHLDISDINRLFELFTREQLKKVWLERLVPQGDYLFNLNVMLAQLYFDIKNPEQYLRSQERKHVKALLGK